ncbi:MAG: Rho termination factor N-terminal domain-containing protein [Candidatus Omnitrophota bacterium]|jgi:hypothetical protein
MATDSGIVTIYDMKNGGDPLTCHRIDAKEFLASPRWSASPTEKSNAIGDAAALESGSDDGKAMQLKSENMKSLLAKAERAGIPDCKKMKKAELVEALLKSEE